MKKFVPVFVACGGDEVSGVDYFIAKKILRKFEQLNISFIRDEIDGFVDFLNKTFGEDKMKECIEGQYDILKMKQYCQIEAKKYDVSRIVTEGLLKKIEIL